MPIVLAFEKGLEEFRLTAEINNLPKRATHITVEKKEWHDLMMSDYMAFIQKYSASKAEGEKGAQLAERYVRHEMWKKCKYP